VEGGIGGGEREWAGQEDKSCAVKQAEDESVK